MTPDRDEALVWRAGLAKREISAYDPRLSMFGWGREDNVPTGVALPLHARAIVLEERATGHRTAWVVCELGMISESVRAAVAARVCDEPHGLTEHDLVVTATHTHAGPSGFSSYLMYAVCAPGVSRRVHDAIVDTIVDAIGAAVARLVPARVFAHDGWIPISEPIAFNRSVAAYGRNADATPVSRERADEAVERTMTILRVDDARGAPLGLVSWLGVHGTSMHGENRSLHADNKGYAAALVEGSAREDGHRDFVALFAQEAAGDVSPNFRWSEPRGVMIGRYDDDDESARFHGAIQARHARSLFQRARDEGRELSGPLETGLRYADFFGAQVDAALALEPEARTAPPCVGLGFAIGTSEGSGPLPGLRRHMAWMSEVTARVRRSSGAAPQAGKIPLWHLAPEPHRHKLFGVLPPRIAAGLPATSRFASYYRRAVRSAALSEVPWVPRHLPVQQVRIGTFVLATMPHEATTQSGRRLRRAILDAWRGGGVERVVVGPYSNAYCGYLTTPEEYDVQAYEGAATLYGRASLPALCSQMRALAGEIRRGRGRADAGARPEVLPLELLPEA